jgi:hypothetical protein
MAAARPEDLLGRPDFFAARAASDAKKSGLRVMSARVRVDTLSSIRQLAADSRADRTILRDGLIVEALAYAKTGSSTVNTVVRNASDAKSD